MSLFQLQEGEHWQLRGNAGVGISARQDAFRGHVRSPKSLRRLQLGTSFVRFIISAERVGFRYLAQPGHYNALPEIMVKFEFRGMAVCTESVRSREEAADGRSKSQEALFSESS